MMSSKFPCFYCREPSSCLATFDKEGKEIWRYVCSVCYKLLESDDYEGLVKRLDEREIIPCEVYFPKPRGMEIQFRTTKELEESG